jgi:hypothetical protein
MWALPIEHTILHWIFLIYLHTISPCKCLARSWHDTFFLIEGLGPYHQAFVIEVQALSSATYCHGNFQLTLFKKKHIYHPII